MKIFGKYTSTISQIPLRSSLDQNVFPHTRWWDDPKCQKSPNWLMPTTPFSYWLGPEVLSCFFTDQSQNFQQIIWYPVLTLSNTSTLWNDFQKYNFLHLQSMLQQGCTSQKVAQYTPGQKNHWLAVGTLGGIQRTPWAPKVQTSFLCE